MKILLKVKMTNDFLPKLDINNFDYDLPKDRIADFPQQKRGESKLLFADLNTENISHHTFSDISELIPEKSLLVVNSTKVISARILMEKVTGGKAELLCVEPIEPSYDPVITMRAKASCRWECMLGGRNINPGAILSARENYELKAKIISKNENNVIAEFYWQSNETFAEILERIGKIPLPPYIKRENIEDDKDRYQTVYAKQQGSVAAPTAGLHFTNEIFNKLTQNGIEKSEIILHVGPGTFKPVEVDDAAEHDMHSEQIFVTKQTIDKLIKATANNENIIATGTTSLRTLETLYWHGAMLQIEEDYFENPTLDLKKYHPYMVKLKDDLPTSAEALNKILVWLEYHNFEILHGKTALYVMPGYDFKIINGLITNYHLPKSTLILLVSALTGFDMWKKIYNEALENDYMFLSYGDSSLLLRQK